MLFSSVIFLLFFLPLSLGLYFLTPRVLRNHALLALSLFFYLWTEGQYALVLLLSLCVNYGLGFAARQKTGSRKPGLRKAALWSAVVFNIGILIFYKYLGFIASQLGLAVHSARIAAVITDISQPIGISFFTFKGLSYVIDSYRGMPVERSVWRYGLYQSFFPQLLAGPIARYHQMAPHLASRSITPEDFWKGSQRFIIGLGKKILIANQLGPVVDQVFDMPVSHLSSASAWLGIICYTLQIYFDFSGYTDMAIGLGKMLGFETPENFNYPYISKSIREFWRRWHITLSEWFRDYVYIPLGGNRDGQFRTWFNLLVVFVLCGLWHGANWTFLAWGLWHGLFLVLERTRAGKRIVLTAGLSHLYTCLVFVFGWVFFRSADLSQAGRYFLTLFGFNTLLQTQSFWSLLNPKVVFLILAGIAGSTAFPRTLCERVAARAEARAPTLVLWNSASLVALLAFLVMSLSVSAFDVRKAFIYFKF